MSTQTANAGILEPLFPPGVACIFSADAATDAQLFAEELSFTKGMVEKRYLEFVHGRDCARQALIRLGAPPSPIRRGSDREPIWPDGLHRQHLTHRPVCCRRGGPTRIVTSLGLDLETAAPMDVKLVDSVCLPAEIDRLPEGDTVEAHAKLLFSIKESIYKCCGHYFENL